MTPGGRIAAAIEVLTQVIDRHQPAPDALRDWGRAHRFAGSGDRGAIGNLVMAALRRRASVAWQMGAQTPRALAIGTYAFVWGNDVAAVAAVCDGSGFAPAALSAAEKSALEAASLEGAPDWVLGDYPEWLDGKFKAVFGASAAQEGAGLATRPPLDLRVNLLKADRERLAKALKRHNVEATALSPVGLRITAPEGPGRLPNVEVEGAHGKGWFEVQDQGSQLAALLAGAKPGEQVVDFCAGAGGKTLALAAAMENRGQIHAHDSDRARLRPLYDRLKRAGARNVQVVPGGEGALAHLEGKADLVLVDAPCSGAGVWRRRPDAKWRLRPHALTRRQEEQGAILREAAKLVRPGGRLVYVTCSVFDEENKQQIQSFTAENSDFTAVPSAQIWPAAVGGECPKSADGNTDFLTLTPATHGTDGFFIASLVRQG
ncbi:MAG: RsmB/NOP family class I SAM-dependent RNA methyltransferase [Alphaproteobacteria bacterium]